MPCKDITERLEIIIDNDDRILDYSLNKLSCGGAVGEEKMISRWLIGRTVSETLATTPDTFQSKLRTTSDIKEYLAVKHFLAVQMGLAVALGYEAGSVNDHCTIESIEYTEKQTKFVILINIDALVDNITACKKCCRTV